MTLTLSDSRVHLIDGETIVWTLTAQDTAEAARIKHLLAKGLTVCAIDGKTTQCGAWGVTGSPTCNGHRVNRSEQAAYFGVTA